MSTPLSSASRSDTKQALHPRRSSLWRSVFERLRLQIEIRRRPAHKPFTSLSQALYQRSTIDAEKELALLLRLPLADVQLRLAQNRLHNRHFEARRNTRVAPEAIRRYCEEIEVEQHQEFHDLLRKDPRSRIVASFHSGDFLFGSARLLSLESDCRQRFVLSLNRSSRACHENVSEVFGAQITDSEWELLLAETSASQLSQLLRQGNTTLLLFCDVPPGLTETTTLLFLGRPASFSIGPALLALVNRVPLLPLVNYFDGTTNRVHLGRQLEPVLLKSETLRQGAARLSQGLIAFFEEIFLRYPQQWRFLPLLPHYYALADESRTCSRRLKQ